jgi:hypothetical protein
VLAARGAFAEEEPLRRRILQARERQLGPEHRDTIACVNNLAFVLKRLEKSQRRSAVLRSHRGSWVVPHFDDGNMCNNGKETNAFSDHLRRRHLSKEI